MTGFLFANTRFSNFCWIGFKRLQASRWRVLGLQLRMPQETFVTCLRIGSELDVGSAAKVEGKSPLGQMSPAGT